MLQDQVKHAGLQRNSILTERLTYSGVISQVDFVDSHGLLELSAVELDQESSYMAEKTSFIGFEAKVRRFYWPLLRPFEKLSVFHVSSTENDTTTHPGVQILTTYVSIPRMHNEPAVRCCTYAVARKGITDCFTWRLRAFELSTCRQSLSTRAPSTWTIATLAAAPRLS